MPIIIQPIRAVPRLIIGGAYTGATTVLPATLTDTTIYFPITDEHNAAATSCVGTYSVTVPAGTSPIATGSIAATATPGVYSFSLPYTALAVSGNYTIAITITAPSHATSTQHIWFYGA